MRMLDKNPVTRMTANELVSICNLGWTSAAAAEGRDAKLEEEEEEEEEKRKREEAERRAEEEKKKADEETRKRESLEREKRELEEKIERLKSEMKPNMDKDEGQIKNAGTLLSFSKSLDEIGVEFGDPSKMRKKKNSIIHNNEEIWVSGFVGEKLDNSVHRMFERFMFFILYLLFVDYLGHSKLNVIQLSAVDLLFYCYD